MAHYDTMCHAWEEVLDWPATDESERERETASDDGRDGPTRDAGREPVA
ncbi:hypothetical protein [Halarchaeum rubridurum]|nr:hypothetical protein [Halarchaeum rubridurum]